MRDQHKPKQQLIDEVVALRKQVADLKEAAVARRRVEEALRASEELYRSVVDGVPAAVCRLGARGELLLANPTLANILGYESKQEMLQLVAVIGLFESQDDERRVLHAADAATDMVLRLRRKDCGSLLARLRAYPAAPGAATGAAIDLVIEPEPAAAEV